MRCGNVPGGDAGDDEYRRTPAEDADEFDADYPDEAPAD